MAGDPTAGCLRAKCTHFHGRRPPPKPPTESGQPFGLWPVLVVVEPLMLPEVRAGTQPNLNHFREVES